MIPDGGPDGRAVTRGAIMKKGVAASDRRRGGAPGPVVGLPHSGAEAVYTALRAQIESGQLGTDDELPSEADLQQMYRLARGTVRRALLRLAQEGFISGGQGRKRVVLGRTPLRLAKLILPSKSYPEGAGTGRRAGRNPSMGEAVRALDRVPTDQVIAPPVRAACDDLAEPRFVGVPPVGEGLALAAADRVLWFGRLRLADGQPVALQWTAVPADLLPDLPRTWAKHLVPGGLTALYEAHGVHRAHVESSYTATLANRDEARLLGLVSGAPLIEERRVSYHRPPGSREEVPYEYLVTLYPERVALTFAWKD